MISRKFLIIFLIITGVIGVIFFFPVNFNDQYTCLYHRMFYEGHMHHNATEAGIHDIHGVNSLLQHYIGHYALLWWASIAVFSISLIILKKRNVNHKTEV